MKAIDFIHAHREEEGYCEGIILPDGEVEEPLPSHINRLLEIAGEDPVLLHGLMDKGMEPLYWLVELTGCMSVWQTRVLSPSRPTPRQLEAVEELHDAALLSPKYLMEQVDESYVRSVRRAREILASK